MSEFEQLVHEAYRSLLDIAPYVDQKEKFFKLMFEQLPERVIDRESLKQIQVDDLFAAMNHTRTITGAATLYRSLIQPLTSLDLILAKQDALRELESNDRLRNAIINFLEEVKKRTSSLDPNMNGEETLYHFLNERSDNIRGEVFFPYVNFRSAIKTGTKIADAARQIPKPDSRYLETLVSTLQRFSNAKSYRLMTVPVYRTYRTFIDFFTNMLNPSMKPKGDIYFLTPRWKFTPRYLSGPAICTTIGSVGIILTGKAGILPQNPLINELNFLAGYFIFTSLMYMGLLKPTTDSITAIKPLARQIRADPEFQLTLDTLGKLDELVSFYEYARAMQPHKMTLPKMEYAARHYFRATNVVNPIMAKNYPYWVPIDITFDGCKLTFYTGRHNAGKTTNGKTVPQIQLMAQIGSYVPAEEAEISIADRIFYAFHLPDILQNQAGDFETDLKRIRDLFYAATPRSLYVFNALASGTTTREEIEQSYGILHDFATIGGNTIYISHRYELVKRFLSERLGQFLKPELKDGRPTFKFITGISTESGAAKIAEEIGFSPEDRRNHLIREGYLKP